MSVSPGTGPRPPGGPRWLLERIVPAGPARDGLLGDMEELWLDRLEERGRIAADTWYLSESSRAAFRYSLDRLRRSRREMAGDRRRKGTGGMDGVLKDLRYAVRTFRRSPGFTLTAILTLALGIGGATAIFTIVDTVLLRTSPWSEPGRLVNVWTTYPHWRGQESLDSFWDRIPLSYPEYEDWREGTRLFEATALYSMLGVTLTDLGAAERLSAGVGTASLLDVLGVRMPKGRWFLPGEDVEGRRLVVLSDGFWKRRFGADPSIAGRTITLNDEPFEVIGVLPRGFALKNVFVAGDDGAHDVWLPIDLEGGLDQRGVHAFDAIGRLAPGATMEAALAEATPLLRGDTPPERRGVRMKPRKEVEAGGLRTPLLLLLAASGLLLAIACGNVATMLLGESMSRRSEMAARTALGASRGRIVRQVLTESLLLGVAGAVAGGFVAFLLTRLVVAYGPALPVAREIGFSVRVLLFGGALGVITGIAFGLAPALSLRRVSLRDAMRGSLQGTTRSMRGLQSGVIALEIAMTLVLMVGSVLLTRTVLNLFAVDTGFGSSNIGVVEVSASTPRFTAERVATAYDRALREMESVPGVERASGINTLPLLGGSSSTSLEIEGRPEETGDAPGPEAHRRVVFPGYHEVMGIPLLDGRLLGDGDAADAPLVMVVSERFARVYWPDRSALGRRVGYDRRWWTVVGVVGDVRHTSLDEEPVATFYVPYAQNPMSSMTLVAATSIDPASLLDGLRNGVRAADSDAAVTGVHTMHSLITRAAEQQRYRAIVIVLFALMAGILAVVGVFGVTARAVSRRAPEIGVRLALGARVRGLTGMIVSGNVMIAAVGLALGVLGSVWATRLLSGFLFEIEASDPLTWLGAVALLFLAVVFASWLAARRIARVDPARVLRAQ